MGYLTGTMGDVNSYNGINRLKPKSGGLGVTSNIDLPNVEAHNAQFANQGNESLFNMDNLNKVSPYISMAGSMGSSLIDSDNTNYNLQYGGQSDAAKGIKAGVGSAIPIFGAINAIGDVAQSALNKGNDYDEYGYNRKEGYGQFYMQAGSIFDPAGSAMHSLEVGGEGSGLRAAMQFGMVPGGGAMQFAYEQKMAKEREAIAKKEEDSQWQLNQFSFSPNLDV